MRHKKAIITVVVLGVTVVTGGYGYLARASLTFSGQSILGDLPSVIDVGSSTLSLQTANDGPITTGQGLFTIGGDLDLALNQVKNFVLENLPSAPTSSATGMMFYNTASSTPQWYNGSSWESLGASSAGYVRAATKVICASDAPDKTNCDVVCPGNGADGQCIQNALVAGDNLLSAGTFTEATSGVSIVSDGVILRGSGPQTVIKIDGSCNTQFGMVGVEGGAQNVIIRDLAIDGNNGNVGAECWPVGLNISNSIDVHAQNLVFQNGYAPAVVPPSGYGLIVGNGSVNFTLTDSRLTNWWNMAWEIRDATSVLLTNNVISGNACIYDNANNVNIRNNVFHNGAVVTGSGCGDVGQVTKGFSLVGNTFLADAVPPSGGRYFQDIENVDNFVIADNVVIVTASTTLGTPGMKIGKYSTSNGVISGNTIENLAQGAPLYEIGGTNMLFTGNNLVFTGNYVSGIVGGTDANLSNSVISGNVIAATGTVIGGIGINLASYHPLGSGNTIEGNLISNIPIGISVTSTFTGTTIINNHWVNVATPIVNLDATTYPAVSSCGTSPVLASGSTNYAGTIAVGSGTTTACTIAFGTAFINAPACQITPSFNDGGHYFSAKSSSGFTVDFVNDAAGQSFDYQCAGINE